MYGKHKGKCKKLRIYIYVNEWGASNLAQSVVVDSADVSSVKQTYC